MMAKVDLGGKICLVTGASRGIGKGIALQLAKAGATVYITGRSLVKQYNTVGSLKETADEIEKDGGKCYALQCDHSKDEDVKRVFEKIEKDEHGQLDILVNNAYSAVNDIFRNIEIPFWEQPISMWDSVNNVGLRNHYLCSVYASKLMVPRKRGLIVNISSFGGLRYLFNVTYGIGKEACDRMAADCAYELRKHNICFVSLWPGPVETEFIREAITKNKFNESTQHSFNPRYLETPEFSGIAICHLAADKNIMKKSGHILMTTDLASEYKFVDVNGNSPASIRSLRFILKGWISYIIPQWIKIPLWVLALYGSKF